MAGSSSASRFDEHAHDRRVCIYPIYLNSKRTIPQGRRLPLRYCVEHPTLPEIKDVLEHLGFEYALEDKTYPRDLLQRGRVRVQLKDPVSGEPKVAEIPSRKVLLQRIGEMIPNLKSRKDPPPEKKVEGLPPGMPPGFPYGMSPARHPGLPMPGMGQMMPGMGGPRGGGKAAIEDGSGGGGGGKQGSNKKKHRK